MKPSLCIVNYNGLSYLSDTLAAARANAGELCEVLVFDNASDDGSRELAEERFPEVRVVRLGQNLGPAPARNAALEYAASDRVLIVDNDVRLTTGCATLLSRALDDYQGAAIAMPAVLYAHRPEVVQYDGADCHFLGQQILHSEDVPLAELALGTRAIGSLITACFMVDRSRLPSSMRFDESFFIYFEDHDFGVRARLLEKEILAVPRARCLHAEGTEGLSLRRLGSTRARESSASSAIGGCSSARTIRCERSCCWCRFLASTSSLSCWWRRGRVGSRSGGARCAG